uniref:probable long-chain-alcohol O-fatty-acyltransferase 5 n=1 Tax=Erigeron canadensis TaxID=72917 RepID=UPI001CB9B13B|nr:probable long-chain-alcohol O-fatty-acyltransferase 5 [Erigeron canadensis]
MDEVEINIIIFFSTIFLALSYSYFISSKLPKGIYKLISLLPIFFTFSILPLLISSAFASAITAFFFTWLANFKLILFAFDQGPLHHTNSLIQFIIIASFPVKLKSNHNNPSKKPSLNLWIELFIFPLLINFIYTQKQNLNPHLLLAIYCCLVFLLVDILIFISNILTKTLIGVELEPPSNEPYLATSLQDFWGRRWNLIVTNTLRQTIYKPVKSIFPNKKWAWLPAIVASFIVSGLMHELLFFYVSTNVTPTKEMTYFFVLHGICVVIELIMKRVLAGRFELPVVVSRLLTVGFVVVTSFWLFFPPLIKSGADVKVLEEFRLFVIKLF